MFCEDETFFASENINKGNKSILSSNPNEFNDETDNEHNIKDKNLQKGKKEIEFISDVQSRGGNNLIVEGNVEVKLGNLRLFADKLIHNEQNNTYEAVGNVRFYSKNQYFEAESLTYDVVNDIGEIIDVYGLIDIKSLSKDLNFNSSESLFDDDEIIKDINNIENIEVYKPSIIGLRNKFKLNSFDLDIKKINRWRFKSKKLTFTSDSISSDRVVFSNDVFNKPQFLVKSNKLTGSIIKENLNLKSKNSFLIFDDKLVLPIGRRSITSRDYNDVWGIGYNKEEFDGFFMTRNFSPTKLSDNFYLKYKPYFLIQRGIVGETSAFSENYSPITSDKITQETEFLDSLGLEAEIYGKIGNWNLNSTSFLNSLNTKRFDRALRTDLILSKSFSFKSYSEESNFLIDDPSLMLSTKKDKNLKFDQNITLNSRELNKVDEHEQWLDFVGYALYRKKIRDDYSNKGDVYKGVGSQVIFNDKLSKKFYERRSLVGIDYGYYEAEAVGSKSLLDLGRFSLSGYIDYKFPLLDFRNSQEQITKDYKYTSKIINSGLNLNTRLSSAIFKYSDGANQNVTTVNVGPEIILGSMKRKFLDYTRLSLSYNYIFKDNESPFKFDNVDVGASINIDFNQQLYGPLIYGYNSNLNVDGNSKDYGKFSDGVYFLDFSRRAYSIGVFYKPSEKSAGIKFKIFNFGYKGIPERF